MKEFSKYFQSEISQEDQSLCSDFDYGLRSIKISTKSEYGDYEEEEINLFCLDDDSCNQTEEEKSNSPDLCELLEANSNMSSVDLPQKYQSKMSSVESDDFYTSSQVSQINRGENEVVDMHNYENMMKELKAIRSLVMQNLKK